MLDFSISLSNNEGRDMNGIFCTDQLDPPTLRAEVPVPPVATCFAPAGRDTPAELCRKAAVIEHRPLLKNALDAMPNMVMILNGNRQIVAANRKLLKVLGASLGELVEKRPGEAIKCIRAQGGPDGCGTGVHCANCGAVHAIIDSMKRNAEDKRECRILAQTSSGVVPLDLRVTASPFEVEDERFVLVAIEDISHEKRVAVLQRTFFHDVLNTAGCIQGYAEYLADDSASEREVTQRLSSLAAQLIEDIQSQRDLIHAESGELKAQSMPVKARLLLEELRNQYLKHAAAAGREISVGPTWEGAIITDVRLLKRILGNMLKNALEATRPNENVALSCVDSGETVTFMVNNREVMPPEVQLQVFQRSFSTKGEAGRGIGTYSMKLFGERYLGGTIDFSSHTPEGTTFRLELPKKPKSSVGENPAVFASVRSLDSRA
jgi:nitrogen-specific signal transduction histidine kinase